MLLARGFSYSDAHRARLGVNYKQIPVNSPHVETTATRKDGAMRIKNVSDPVYAPNSYGGPAAQPELTDDGGLWYADGDMVRSAYSRTRRTTTGARRARWCARCSTTPPASDWSTTSSGTCSTG